MAGSAESQRPGRARPTPQFGARAARNLRAPPEAGDVREAHFPLGEGRRDDAEAVRAAAGSARPEPLTAPGPPTPGERGCPARPPADGSSRPQPVGAARDARPSAQGARSHLPCQRYESAIRGPSGPRDPPTTAPGPPSGGPHQKGEPATPRPRAGAARLAGPHLLGLRQVRRGARAGEWPESHPTARPLRLNSLARSPCCGGRGGEGTTPTPSRGPAVPLPARRGYPHPARSPQSRRVRGWRAPEKGRRQGKDPSQPTSAAPPQPSGESSPRCGWGWGPGRPGSPLSRERQLRWDPNPPQL